jgi:hypothetical protein
MSGMTDEISTLNFVCLISTGKRDVSSLWGRRLVYELVAHCGSLKAQDGVLCNLQLVRLAHHLKAKGFRPRLQKLRHCRKHKPLHPQLTKQLQAHQ